MWISRFAGTILHILISHVCVLYRTVITPLKRISMVSLLYRCGLWYQHDIMLVSSWYYTIVFPVLECHHIDIMLSQCDVVLILHGVIPILNNIDRLYQGYAPLWSKRKSIIVRILLCCKLLCCFKESFLKSNAGMCILEGLNQKLYIKLQNWEQKEWYNYFNFSVAFIA